MMKKAKKNKPFKFVPPSKKQIKVQTWWIADKIKEHDGIIADGAIRSGKTMSMSMAYVAWSMECFDGENFIIAGKTVGSCRRNVIGPLKKMLATLGYFAQDHRSENYLTISKNGKENEYFVFGGKDEASQDLVQGITAAGAFFDEVALMPESFVNQATGRCSVDGSKFWFNCNPGSPYHWFKVKWLDKILEKNLLHLHFTMDDNPSLSEHIKARYRSMYSGVFYKRYILGLWVMAEGLIYDMFGREKHTIKPEDIPAIQPNSYYVSCDYGTQNATVFLLWGKGFDGIWYCIKEYYYSGRDSDIQKTDTEYADDLEGWLNGIKLQRIVVDPSAASFIAELKKRGYRVKKAVNNVLDGIRFFASLLQEPKVKISTECGMTLKEFASYVWDEKAADRGEDKPVKVFDHAMDAVRYFGYTIIRKPSGLSVMK
jgi:phage terminase, large subunit, PBSX family|nr:MAG TPA: large terminase [Caudoviricetes sp.]